MQKQKIQICLLTILLLLIIFLSGCGIGTTNTDTSNATTAQMTGKVTISGTIAKGNAISNAPVKIKDKDGKTKEATSGSDGKYEADVSDMSAPFVVKVKVPEGDKNLYSVATQTGTANVHPFTDLVVRNWYEVKGTDIDTAFDNEGAIPNPPTTTEIDTIEAVVKNTLATFLTQMGLDTTKFNMFTKNRDSDHFVIDKR